jgi:N-succinyldiaminopimelate aminotransferase
MSLTVQHASIAAWNDEAHVVANRELYRRKFAQVTPLVASVMDVALPDAGFYLWADISSLRTSTLRAGGDDVAFARELLAQYNVAVLPGSLLARPAGGVNPGAGRIRMALVADTEECLEAARRIVAFVQSSFPVTP